MSAPLRNIRLMLPGPCLPENEEWGRAMRSSVLCASWVLALKARMGTDLHPNLPNLGSSIQGHLTSYGSIKQKER